MGNNVLISIFDYTGNASMPYREAGWEVMQIDIQHGQDIMEWDYKMWLMGNYGTAPFDDIGLRIGIIAMIPCTDYANSGAKHFKRKDSDGSTEKSQKLVAKTKEIIDFFETKGVLIFWQIENPMSRIHKLNPWMGKQTLKFNPCDFAGYDPAPEKSRYNKRTWLWGKFKIPERKYLPPFGKDYPGFRKLGGKSLKTKNLRSITPMGFAYAFYHANH
jgi:hypothetical protein